MSQNLHHLLLELATGFSPNNYEGTNRIVRSEEETDRIFLEKLLHLQKCAVVFKHDHNLKTYHVKT